MISRRERVETVTYERVFDHEDEPGRGAAFPCDKDGYVDVNALHPCARANYEECLSGSRRVLQGAQYDRNHEPVPGTGHYVTVKMIDRGVREWRRSRIEPAVGQCACGARVYLDGFTNSCHECGRDYNMSGQLLAPRSQWGEETGESVDDILAIDVTDTERLLDTK